MSNLGSPGEVRSRTLTPFLRGIFLQFDQREPPAYAASAGLRLLVIVIVLELVIGPRTHVLELFDLPQPPAWLRIGTLLLEALVAVRLWANLQLRDVGFLSPLNWTPTEQIYVLQIVAVAGVAFIAMRGAELGLLTGDQAPWIAAAFLIGPQLLWGFYQEVIYRGLLQTELTRRWGGVAGVLLANLAFTFGPLHFYHLMAMRPETMNATIVTLAATFAIGLLFAFIFHRTRNIWLVSLMHGIGNAFTNTLGP